MTIDAKTVAELRRRTGLPMMKCKEALAEANGDVDVAADNLRKLGLKTAEKVKDRTLKEGLVFHAVQGSHAAAVAVLCETDFVARSADFDAFGKALAAALLAGAPGDAGDGSALEGFALEDGRQVGQVVQDLIAKIRENIKVGAWARFAPEQGLVSSYVHHNGKIACLVEFAGAGLADSEPVLQLGKDLGMQIAFHADVQALRREELDPVWIAKEREIFVAQAQEMPADRRDKIAEGKLNKRLKDVVLLEQPFIKNDKEAVSAHVAAVAREAGVSVEVRRFARIAAGA